MDPAIVACLPEWQFDITRLVIQPNPTLPARDQVAALRTTLQQLQAMQTAPGSACVVELAGWFWTPDMPYAHDLLAVVSAAIRASPQISYEVRLGSWLNDQTLAAIVKSGPNIRHVAANHMHVTTEQSASTAWPWEELRFTGLLHVPSLVKLPRPSDGARVLCDSLTFHSVTRQVRVYTHTHRDEHLHLHAHTHTHTHTHTALSPCLTVVTIVSQGR